MEKKQIKWWGWGDADKSFDLLKREYFFPYLKTKIDIPSKPFLFPPLPEEVEIPKILLSNEQILRLKKIFRDEQIFTSKLQRISHTYGKSYHDLIRIRYKKFNSVPDIIIYPESKEQILELLKWSEENNVAIIPFGGGTSVVGGVEAVREEGQNGIITVNLTRMNRVLRIDKKSLTVDAEAGILGPQLEESLRVEGMTLSHYPESFEFSTLGGWIAARSAGQQSTLYGKIEDMVESLQTVTPLGIMETPPHPAAAVGPDQNHLVIGSEGILGIITEARMRIKPIPQKKFYTALLIDNFENGIEICRKIMQYGLKPATVRLSDPEETEFIFSLQKQKGFFLLNKIQKAVIERAERKGLSAGKRSFLLLGLEGMSMETEYQWKSIQRILSNYKTFNLGEKAGKSWYRHRFENPYLRDILLDYDILVDTMETSTEWSNVDNLYNAVIKAINDAFKRLKIKGVVTAHLSHLYTTGCSLYFVIVASPEIEKEIETWKIIKRAASEAIIEKQGSISHHHGIGIDHRSWLKHDIGKISVEWLRNSKQHFDPKNILNPCKLLPEAPASSDGFIQQMKSKEERLDFSADVRKRYIRKLKTEQFDILVIGGGITGAGILRDAALRGYKTALIEKDDFSAGTSSKSSKLVHGGFRYLKNLELGLVYEALMERKNLMDIAPHLVHPIECLLPIYENSSLPPWLMKLGMLLYDGIAFTKRIGSHKMITVEGNSDVEPALRNEGLKKIAVYFDSWADDFRLVMATIQSAAKNGGIAVNYLKAVDVINENGKLIGIKVKDNISGEEFPVRARITVNATGPWCDQLRKTLLKDKKRYVRTTKGIHLLLLKKHLPIKHTIVLSAVQDARPVFAVPWRNFVILGTTDTDYNDDLDIIPTENEDVKYLLDTFKYYFPKQNLTEEKIISTFTGLRPLTYEEEKSASDVTREYQIFEEPEYFFNIIGGKLTTYRTMAQELVDRISKALESYFKIKPINAKCTTDKIHLYGGDISDYDKFQEDWREHLVTKYKFDTDVADHFIETFGSRIPELLDAVQETPYGKERILQHLPHVWGELTYACKHEMVMGLDDFLIRRTHLFSLDPEQAWSIHEIAADRLGKYLHWSEEEKLTQVERYKSKIKVIQNYRNKNY